ncbi:MAG: TraB/GumN family protein [Crocinitomicaceae bacterium]|nr:TraB/GumN family protein [Crocinitomicaceae bacterium]
MIKVSFLSILIHVSLCCISQENSNSLLWKITGSEKNKISYLYGTIHMVKKEDFVIKEKVKKAFNKCEVLALEVNLKMSLKTKMNLAMQTLLPKGKSVKDFISKEDFQLLSSYAKDSINLSDKKFKNYLKLKPFFLSSILIKESLGKIKSYDEEFYKMSSKKKMRHIGLEKIEDQLRMVNQISFKEQGEMMMHGITNNENSFEKLVQAYLDEDLNLLSKLISNDSQNLKEFEYNFLVKRNQKWIPIIEKTIQKHNSFIAVGAGHLFGENGVISLLKKNGYEVAPVFN